MKKSTIPPLLGVVVGLGLIASSFYWTSPLGPQPQWTEQQAQAYQRAGAKYHQIKGHAPVTSSEGKDAETESEDIRLARQEWDRQNAKLQAVQLGHKRTALTLWWSGIVLSALGVLGLLLIGRRSE
jgi:hypothetical protein